MPFDISTAVDLTPQETIPTTKFDISTAEDPNQEKKVSPLSKFLRLIFRDSPLEQVQTLQYELDNNKTLPNLQNGESFNDFRKRWNDFLAPQENKIINEGVARQLEVPMAMAVAAGGVTAPLATAAGVAAFSIKDHFFNGRRFMEENYPNSAPLLKDVVEIVDLVGTGAALGGGAAAFERTKDFTLKRLDSINAPKTVQINPDKVQILKSNDEAIQTLGIDPEQIVASINTQKPLEVPVEKVIDLASQKDWPQIKEDIGLIKPQEEVQIPQFKYTGDAVEFGKANKDNPEVLAELQKKYDELITKNKEIHALGDNATDEQLNQGFLAGQKAQLYREALEGASGEIKKVPTIADLENKLKNVPAPNAIENKSPSPEIIQPLTTEQQKVETPVNSPLIKSLPQENQTVKSTVQPDEGMKVNLARVKEIGDKGYSIESNGAERFVVFRDNEGKAKGILRFTVDKNNAVESRADYTIGNSVYVVPELRRQGIATGLYDFAKKEGYDVDNISGKFDLTPDGAKFVSSRNPSEPPKINELNKPEGGKERGFITSVKESPQVTKETKAGIENLPPEAKTYDVYSDPEAIAKAQERVSKDSEAALSYVMSNESFNKDVATTGIELMRKYREQGKTEQEVNLAAHLAEKATEGGQFIQAFSILDKMSPEGILMFAHREINRGIESTSKKKVITPEFADALKKQAQTIQDTPYGYQKVLEVKKLAEMIAEKKGKSKKDFLVELANLPRALSASLLDFSFGGRQGIFLAPSFAKEWGGAFAKQFGAFAKQENYNALMDSIMKNPDFQTAVDSGVSFTDIRTKLNKVEEKYLGAQLAEKIPIVGKGVLATERAYTGMANKMRMDIFSQMLKDYEKQGITPDEKLLKQTAEFVNAGTGRGSLGVFEKAASVLNAFFFSPRLMASRLTLLNPAYYVTKSPALRKQALKSLFSFIGYGATLLTLAKLSGAQVGTDPRSADFGKIKIGQTRIDVWGGFQQYVRAFSQLATGKYINSSTGKELTLGEGYKPLTRLDIVMRQIQSKEAPVFSLITELLIGKTWDGKKINVPAEVAKKFIPMVAQDMYDLYQQDPSTIPIGILSIFGEGVQTYQKKQNKF